MLAYCFPANVLAPQWSGSGTLHTHMNSLSSSATFLSCAMLRPPTCCTYTGRPWAGGGSKLEVGLEVGLGDVRSTRWQAAARHPCIHLLRTCLNTPTFAHPYPYHKLPLRHGAHSTSMPTDTQTHTLSLRFVFLVLYNTHTHASHLLVYFVIALGKILEDLIALREVEVLCEQGCGDWVAVACFYPRRSPILR